MKTCSKCNTTREYALFSKDIRNKDGYQSQCQVCRKEAKKKVNDARAGIVTVTNKVCNKCGKHKQSQDFFKDKGISDGLGTICKVCKTEATMAWRFANREKYNENQRKQHKKNYVRNRLYRYDLTPEEYAALLLSQNNKCAICEKPPKGKRPLVVDHRHSDKKVRGLLCYGCNRALHILESIELLAKAQAYLKKYEK